MERYISPDDVVKSSFSSGRGFTELEIAGVLAELEETQKTVIYNVGIGGSIAAQPLLKDNRIYIGACDKNFYCIDAKTGKEIWRFRTQGPNVYTATVSGDTVFFASYDKNLYALSIADGSLLWKREIGEKATAPFISGDKIFLGCRDNKVYCFSKSGDKLWSFKTNGYVSSSPAPYKGAVYFGSWDRNFYAVDEDGNLLWKFATQGEIIDRGVIKDDVIYFGAFDGNFYALKTDGTLLWKFSVTVPIDSTPCVTDRHVYFLSHEGTLHSLSLDGREEWNFKTNAFPGLGVAVSDGIVCFPSTSNNLYAVSEDDGSLLWKFAAKAPMASIPTVHKKGFLVGSWDCHLYNISKQGELIWKFSTSLSYMAPLDIEPMGPPTKTLHVIWQPAITKEEKLKPEEERARDYDSEFRSDYTGSMGMNYLGFEKEETPFSRKKKHYSK